MDGGGSKRSQLRGLLEHFAEVRDPREPAKVRYPLPEVLLLVVAASIARCDDYDEMAERGEARLSLRRGFSEFHFGVPEADWLRVVVNRIDPALFQACFAGWAASSRSDAADLIAIYGETSQYSHDRGRGRHALHLISATLDRPSPIQPFGADRFTMASTRRMVLAQKAGADKDGECGAILYLLNRLAVDGAPVTINVVACNPAVAVAVTGRGGNSLSAMKANQPTLYSEVTRYFADSPPSPPLRAIPGVMSPKGDRARVPNAPIGIRATAGSKAGGPWSAAPAIGSATPSALWASPGPPASPWSRPPSKGRRHQWRYATAPTRPP